MLENLIKNYFFENDIYLEIRDMLFHNDGIKISLSTIKRILSSLNLKRKNVEESNIEDIVSAVVEELHSAGYNLGYRSLWNKLQKKYNLTVKRSTVYKLLKIADPIGIENRFGNKLHQRQYLSPGPNFLWHLDGYDKLKQFGFAIHGCVDGFSRRIIWLEVATTNNDPKVVAYFYLNAVKKLKFLPTIIRCDNGTENTLIGLLQICLRTNHTDNLAGNISFIQGRSVNNQRIESYWGRMRQHTVDFYIQLFKCMQQQNFFNGSALHIKCLQYCFVPLIKYDLESNKQLWNEHRIRKQVAQNNIAGKPNVMFHCSEKYNCRNFKKNVNTTDIEKLIISFTVKPKLFDPNFEELVRLVMPNVVIPSNPSEALILYKNILSSIAAYTSQT